MGSPTPNLCMSTIPSLRSSRAPQDQIRAYQDQQGWSTPWYSCETAFSEDMDTLPNGNDMSAINVFIREGEEISRTWWDGGMDSVSNGMDWQRGLLNLTPRGAEGE